MPASPSDRRPPPTRTWPRTDQPRNVREITESNRRFVEELGEQPDLFAYPYGEASTEVMGLAEAGFHRRLRPAFRCLDRYSPQFYLPRFPVNETYGDEARFRRVVNTLSIPIQGITPEDPLIGEVNPPAFGFPWSRRSRAWPSWPATIPRSGRSRSSVWECCGSRSGSTSRFRPDAHG